MNHHFVPRAASRARWLAELTTALDEAQKLLSQLAAQQINQADADGLRARIDDLRAELRMLHRRGFMPSQIVEPPRLLHADWRPRRD
jgi:hypothetical protein